VLEDAAPGPDGPLRPEGSILRGGYTKGLPERPIEVALIVEANFLSHLSQTAVGMTQQGARALQSQPHDPGMWRHADRLLEELEEMEAFKVAEGSKLIEGDFFGQMDVALLFDSLPLRPCECAFDKLRLEQTRLDEQAPQ
jgi:hypothetical protein